MKRILPLLFKSIAALLLPLVLTSCAIFGDPTELDDTKGWQADRIYAEGEQKMLDKDYDQALRYFQILESRFPHGKYATQAQLEIAYAYYKKQDPVSTVAAADRFIKLHPNHPNVDYAYYIKGLASFNERGVIEKYTAQEISDRDPKTLKVSFAALKELVERFPKSRYYKDATQRMVYLVNTLAQHELHVARYYMNRTAYLAALNRAKYVLEYYPNSTSVEEALVISISAYDYMDLTDLKEDTLRILKTNYPENPMILGKVTNDERVWWKFWESMY
ncbi:outer membrane protein assembly factor BamD [Methylotenera versatilis]|uniref:outer membrane protein assembly factor BamD n=1 Tax=Methylotenera versatilis TaxID=1055487 RepID=UPI0006481C46|nr:outer membrane protein assembly factor BamD [Methylotenera versatilis]